MCKTSYHLKCRGNMRRVIALDPDNIVYPKKVTMLTDFMFIGWKKWVQPAYKNCKAIEYLPIELGRLMKYKLITREQHNNIIKMLRSEDLEDVDIAHQIIAGMKNKRHKTK